MEIIENTNNIKVIALPKRIFENRFNTEFINNTIDKVAYISILDKDNEELKYEGVGNNFLQVHFYDIEEDLYEDGNIKYHKPSDEELKKIVDFVNEHKDKKLFFVHCSAGISRSGAVARYISELFETPSKEFVKFNPYIMPNLYILKRLKELNNL